MLESGIAHVLATPPAHGRQPCVRRLLRIGLGEALLEPESGQAPLPNDAVIISAGGVACCRSTCLKKSASSLKPDMGPNRRLHARLYYVVNYHTDGRNPLFTPLYSIH